MLKGKVGDVVDVNGCTGFNPGTVISADDTFAMVRWRDGGGGDWRWDRLFLITAAPTKEPVFELSVSEVEEILRRVPPDTKGPISERMRAFVEPIRKEKKAAKIRAEIDKLKEDLRKLEAGE